MSELADIKVIANQTVEAKVLSCILYEPRAYHTVSKAVTREHFWAEAHRRIWDAIVEIVEAGGEPSLSTVESKLDQRGHLDAVGGVSFIRRIASDIHLESEAGPLAEILHDYYLSRRYHSLGTQLRYGIEQGDLQPSDAHELVTEEVRSISTSTTGAKGVSLGDGLKEWFPTFEARANGEESLYFPTHIAPVDYALSGGIVLNRMYVTAARPKMGKTKLAIAITGELMRRHGFHVEFWYTDGSRTDVINEYIGWAGKVRTDWLQNPQDIPENAQNKFHSDVQQAVADLKGFGSMNVYADGSPRIQEIELVTRSVAAQTDKPIVLVVDYMQNATAGHTGASADYANATDVSRGLGALRTDIDNIVVFALAQFNRGAVQGDGMPQPHQLRNSGQIEQDVNHLLIWHRPAQLDENASPSELRKGALWHAMSKHTPQRRAEVDADLARNNFTDGRFADKSRGSSYGF